MKCAKCGSVSHLRVRKPREWFRYTLGTASQHASSLSAIMTKVGKRSAVEMWPSANAAGLPGQVSGVAFHCLAGSGSSACYPRLVSR